jgi:hypothetical protein
MDASDILLTDGIDSPLEFVSEFKFSLHHIPTEITVRLYRPLTGRGIMSKQSHFIKTPVQINEYQTSTPGADSPEEALNRVVQGFLNFYHHAVQAGHKPAESWLVPHKSFA